MYACQEIWKKDNRTLTGISRFIYVQWVLWVAGSEKTTTLSCRYFVRQHNVWMFYHQFTSLHRLCQKCALAPPICPSLYHSTCTFYSQPQAVDPMLKMCIGDFLKMLQDPDLNVRRVALVTFNSAAHNKPSLIRDMLESVLPHLYNETKVRVSVFRQSCCGLSCFYNKTQNRLIVWMLSIPELSG